MSKYIMFYSPTDIVIVDGEEPTTDRTAPKEGLYEYCVDEDHWYIWEHAINPSTQEVTNHFTEKTLDPEEVPPEYKIAVLLHK